MKIKINNSINKLGLVFLMLTSMFICGCSCNTSKPTPSPLVGWWVDVNHEPAPIIVKDYQDYIQTLSSEERKYIGPIIIYANGTGQHAVEIQIALNGTDWGHVLIYDKDNKRIKVIKYKIGHYAS